MSQNLSSAAVVIGALRVNMGHKRNNSLYFMSLIYTGMPYGLPILTKPTLQTSVGKSSQC